MLKTICEEPIVTEKLARAEGKYPRVWDVYEALCWVLARRQISGTIIKNVYHLHKQEAVRQWGVPSLTVIYTVDETTITILAIKVG